MGIEGFEEWDEERLEDTIGQWEAEVMNEDDTTVTDLNLTLGNRSIHYPYRRRTPRGAFDGNSVNTNSCSRCSGSGYLPEFSHVEGGVCFRCRGTGRDPGASRRRYFRGFRS